MNLVPATTLIVGVFVTTISHGQESVIEKYVASIQSVQQVKQSLKAALTAECGTGSCVNNNATEICTLVGALDLRLGSLISNTDASYVPKPEIPISSSDTQLFKRIWKQCRPTNYQYWNYGTVLHVAYEVDPHEDIEIRRSLGLVTRSKLPVDPPTVRGDSSSTIDKKLTQCLLPKAQYGQYSSYDGGKSARSLLEQACQSEYVEWVKSCVGAGDTQQGCVLKAALLAQTTIKLFNK